MLLLKYKYMVAGIVENPEEPIGGDGVNYDVYADAQKSSASNDFGAKTKITRTGKEVQYSSEDIDKRGPVDYFVRVEGAEKQKREEERKVALEGRRRVREIRKADKEYREDVAKQTPDAKTSEKLRKETEKKLHREESRRARAVFREKTRNRFHALVKFLFGGKRKFITLGIVVLIVSAFTLLNWFMANIYPVEQQKTEARDAVFKQMANTEDFVTEIYSIYGDGINGDGYEKACKRAEELIDSARGNDQDKEFDWSIDYAMFILSRMPTDAEVAFQYIEAVEKYVTNDIYKSRLYNAYIAYYGVVEIESEVERYRGLINELKIIESEDGVEVL
jgi:hypothetical protein